MINRITKFSAVAIMATTALFFQGCSDEFLQDKKAYGAVTIIIIACGVIMLAFTKKFDKMVEGK